jgi:hypothetical protein
VYVPAQGEGVEQCAANWHPKVRKEAQLTMSGAENIVHLDEANAS